MCIFTVLFNGMYINKQLFTCEVQGKMLSSVKLELFWVNKQTQMVYIEFGTPVQEVASLVMWLCNYFPPSGAKKWKYGPFPFTPCYTLPSQR